MLQMLIALMILMALLDQSMKPDGSGQDALGSLGSQSSGQSPTMSLYASSTTISLEYTSTSIVVSSADSYGANGLAEAMPQGGSIDTTV
jgi:hypothetical protein